MTRKRPAVRGFAIPYLVRLLAIPALVACSADEIASPDAAEDKNAARPSLGLVTYQEDLVVAYDVTTGNTYEYRPVDGVLRIKRGHQVFDIEIDASTQTRALDFVLGVAANSGFVQVTEGISGDFPPPQCGNGDMSGCQMNIRRNPESSTQVSDSRGTVIALGPNMLLRKSSKPSIGLTPSVMSLSGTDPCPAIGQAIANQRVAAIAKAHSVNSTVDNVLSRIEIEYGAAGPKLTIPNAGALAMEVLMDLAERFTDRTAMNITTVQWNSNNCGNRKITAGASQTGMRVQGVGGAGGVGGAFVMVSCTVFTYQISFNGGNTWVTTHTEVKCTSSNMMN